MKTPPPVTDDHSTDVADAPWKIGFSECCGKQSKYDCYNLILSVFPPFSFSVLFVVLEMNRGSGGSL